MTKHFHRLSENSEDPDAAVMETRRCQRNAKMYRQGAQRQIVFHSQQALVRIQHASPLLDLLPLARHRPRPETDPPRPWRITQTFDWPSTAEHFEHRLCCRRERFRKCVLKICSSVELGQDCLRWTSLEVPATGEYYWVDPRLPTAPRSRADPNRLARAAMAQAIWKRNLQLYCCAFSDQRRLQFSPEYAKTDSILEII